MGFGSSAASMIAVIRNNKKLLKTRKHFDSNNLGGYSEYNKPEYDLPKATPQVLRGIRQNMEREREIFQRRALIVGVLFVLVAVSLLIFLG